MFGGLLSACGPERVVIPSGADFAVIAVVTDDTAAPTVVLIKGDERAEIEVDEDANVFLWPMPAPRRADGRPLSAAAMAALTARLEAGEDKSGCHHCPAPTIEPPLILHPGASCPLPELAGIMAKSLEGGELRDGGPGASVIGPRIRIDDPGRCPCSVDETPRGQPQALCLLRGQDRLAPRHLVMTPDGALYGRDGEATELSAPAGAPGRIVVPDDISNPQGIAALPEGPAAWVVLYEPGNTTSQAGLSLVEQIEGDLDRRDLLREPLDFNPRAMALLDADPIRLEVGGWRRRSNGGRVPVAFRCTLDREAERADCVERAVDTGDCSDDSPLEAFALDSEGRLIGFARNLAIYRENENGVLTCTGAPALGGLEVEGVRKWLGRVELIGDRVLLCGQGLREEQAGAFVATAEIDDAGTFEILLFETSAARCEGVMRTPGTRTFSLSNGAGVRTATTGALIEVLDLSALAPSIAGDITRIHDAQPDWTLVQTQRGVTYRRFRDGPFEHVFGSEESDSRPVLALGRLDAERLYVAHNPGAPFTVPADATSCDALAPEPMPPLSGLEDFGTDSLHVHPDGQTLLLAGRGGQPQWWVRRVDPFAGEVLNTVAAPSRVRTVRWLDGERALVLLRSGELFELTAGALEPIEATSNDPATADREPEPARSDRAPFFGLDVANGVAWVGGDASIGRVLARAPDQPLDLEAFWYGRAFVLPTTDFNRRRAPYLTAVRAHCGNRARFGVQDDTVRVSNGDSESWAVLGTTHAAPSAPCSAPHPGSALAVCTERLGRTGTDAAVIAVTGDQDPLTIAENGDLFYRGEELALPLPYHTITSAAGDDGVILIGSIHGQLGAVLLF